MKIAFPTNTKKTIASHIGLAKGFLIIDTNTNEETYIPNPVLDIIKQNNINLKEKHKGLGTGIIITELLEKEGVDIFVAQDFGEGMLRNLNRTGIEPFITDDKEIRSVLHHLKEMAINKQHTTPNRCNNHQHRYRHRQGWN